MYVPKKPKYNIYQKHRQFKINYIQNIFLFGNIAVKNKNIAYISNKHFHRLMLYFNRLYKKKKYNFKRIWIPYFPNIPIFKKSRNSRMGKGKGSKINWKAILYPNISLVESKNIRIGRFIYFMNIVITRLPVNARIINNN